MTDPNDLDRRQRQLETLDRLSQRFGTSLSDAFSKNVSEGKRLEGVLNSLGRVLMNATLKAALRPLQTSLKGAFTGLFKGMFGDAGTGEEPAAFARGGVLSRGQVMPFASGGVISAPTYFPMRGGLGLMGERGAEAIMPLARGPDGRLGVRAGGGEPRPVAVTVNIATPDAEGFRRSEAQVAAALARAVARGQRGL